MLSRRAATLTPSPKISSPSTIMSPTIDAKCETRSSRPAAYRHFVPALRAEYRWPTNRIDCTCELYQRAIASSLEDAGRDTPRFFGSMRDLRRDLSAARVPSSSPPIQATVAYDVSREDCGKPSFGTRFGHGIPQPVVMAAGAYDRGWAFAMRQWMAPERRFGSTATHSRCPRNVRFCSEGDQIAALAN